MFNNPRYVRSDEFGLRHAGGQLIFSVLDLENDK